MKPATVFVLIYKDGATWVYSRYEGRKHTDRFFRDDELSAHWVEEIRRDPTQFAAPAG